MGTRINDLQVIKVVDGDTIDVMLDGKEERLRLICIDTEESHGGGSKPVTNAGKLASEWAKNYFNENNGSLSKVDVEFDTNDPVNVCLKKHRGNYGRLICYVHKGGENYNLRAISEGLSPYFPKYGRSREYHKEFVTEEAKAQATNLPIWNPETNQGGKTRDYTELIPWWSLRALAVEDYRRHGLDSGALSVRIDYEAIQDAAKNEQEGTVLCDLQAGINKWTSGGALIFAGSKFHKFNLWIPNVDDEDKQALVRLIETRYAGKRRGYVYVSGKITEYGGKPQIILESIDQLSDFP